MQPIIGSILLAFLLFLCHVRADTIRQEERKILKDILGVDKYDRRIRPESPLGKGPVRVEINIYIRSISEIDDIKMEYGVQLTFRQQWTDARLSFSPNMGLDYLTLTEPEKIWMPDVFFSNEKRGHFHDIVMPNTLLRIKPNGEVLYSTRISMKLSCPMDLRYYPMDRQECSIIMASYGYTTNDIEFVWKEQDPVQFTTLLNLPRFTLNGNKTEYCSSTTNTGTYSCLKVVLSLSRNFNYYLCQVYIPCTMLVMLSWIAFWLDPAATTARLSVSVTLLLTAVIVMSGINLKAPAVSYTKAIDVFTGFCMMFLFAVLIEIVIVAQAVIREDRLRSKAADDSMAMKPLVSHNDDHGMERNEHLENRSQAAFLKRWLNKFPSRGQKIDAISRFLFPALFVFFNVVYWSSYA